MLSRNGCCHRQPERYRASGEAGIQAAVRVAGWLRVRVQTRPNGLMSSSLRAFRRGTSRVRVRVRIKIQECARKTLDEDCG